MRKKHQISQLETQVAELAATVAALLEVVTCPTPAVKVRKAAEADKARMRWTTEEDQLLLALWKKATPQVAMCAILGRSEKSVSVRLSKIRMGRA